MTATTFNCIDKYYDKESALNGLTYEEKLDLLEAQIHFIYRIWNDSNAKINQFMSSYTALRDEENLKKQIFYYDNLVSQAEWINKKISYPVSRPQSIYQWSIFCCDLGYNIGSEQNKRRPVLILNDTTFINSSMAIIAPITGNGKKQYKHEVKLFETAYNRVVGKVDLSHIRSVSMARLDDKPVDRLLNYDEYVAKYGSDNYTMLQDTIQQKIKLILGIAI